MIESFPLKCKYYLQCREHARNIRKSDTGSRTNATTEEAARERLDVLTQIWGNKYSLAVQPWKQNWANLPPFFKFLDEIRTKIYTIRQWRNVEALHRSFRKVTKSRSLFPDDTNQKSEVRSQNPEARIQEPEVRSQNPGTRSQKSESRSQNPGARIRKNIQELSYITTRAQRNQRNSCHLLLRRRRSLWRRLPIDDALKKMLYLAYTDIAKKWTMPVSNRLLIITHFSIIYDERLALSI